MKLIFPSPPIDGVKTLQPILQTALHTEGYGINPQFASVSAERIRLFSPYREYFLSLDALVKGQGYAQSVVGNWHYLVFSNDTVLADIQLKEVNGRGEFSALNYGKMTNAFIRALHLANNTQRLKGKCFELRSLLVPALSFVAVWLHAENENIFIPIEPTPASIGLFQLIDENALLARLVPMAQQR